MRFHQVADFPARARTLIGLWAKVDGLAERIIDGLETAGSEIA